MKRIFQGYSILFSRDTGKVTQGIQNEMQREKYTERKAYWDRYRLKYTERAVYWEKYKLKYTERKREAYWERYTKIYTGRRVTEKEKEKDRKRERGRQISRQWEKKNVRDEDI